MMVKRMVIVLQRQQPFLLFFLVLTTLSGLGFLLNPDVGDGEEIPLFVRYGWAWCMLATGSLGLAGVALQRWRMIRGILLVRGALMAQSGSVVAYMAFVIGFQVEQWMLSTVAAGVWVWACLAEARLLRKDIRRIDQAASDEH